MKLDNRAENQKTLEGMGNASLGPWKVLEQI
jgi:hypothetical protein